MPEEGIRCRARALGISIGTLPTGPLNAITDVPDVTVGHCSVWWGGPGLPVGHGPARTASPPSCRTRATSSTTAPGRASSS